MKALTRLSLASLAILLLAACSPNQAPVEDLGKKYYGRGEGSASYGEADDNSSSYSPGTPASRPVKAAAVPTVGESDLPPVQANQKHSPNGNDVNTYGGSNTDNSITVTNEDISSPFNTPPSKPLEQPAAAPVAGAADASAPGKVYAHDGIGLIWPVTGGKITAHFKGAENDGINISLEEGEPIVAAASGTVVYSGDDLKDYGNMVILRHDNSWLTAYANASRLAVKKGQHVKQGDIIAYVGASGNAKTPQLHFSLRKGRAPVDPEQYLPKK
ncbi:MAG TPA: M23 family metallopeptidase [Rickettsiales bacterium]|nr:M23 family metallopeptidase [Rickettsiales bacterium]